MSFHPLVVVDNDEPPVQRNLASALRKRNEPFDSVTGDHHGRGAGTRADLLNLPTAGSIPAASTISPSTSPIRSKHTRTGLIALHRLQQFALEHDIAISVAPEGCVYDVIIDWNNQLYRVQLKSRERDKRYPRHVILSFGAAPNTKKLLRYRATEIDAIIVYVPSLDQFLWLSPDIFDEKNSITIIIDKKHYGKSVSFEEVIWNV